jgi:hypothetical protein
VTGFLYNHNSPLFQGLGGVLQDTLQAINHMWCARIVQAEKDDAYSAAARERDDLAEIEIKGQDNSFLRRRLFEYLAVWHPLESFVTKVDYIVSLATQPFDNPLSNPHVRKESHRSPLSGVHFFLGQPCGIGKRLPDVLSFQIRIVRQDLVHRCSVSDLSDNDRDWDAHPPNTGSSPHNLRIERNPVPCLHMNTPKVISSILTQIVHQIQIPPTKKDRRVEATLPVVGGIAVVHICLAYLAKCVLDFPCALRDNP